MVNRDLLPLLMHDVSKSYSIAGKRRKVVENFSLEVAASEIVWVSGASGAGKSTILRLAGLLTVPDSGEVRIQGEHAETPRGRDNLRSGALGIVFQDAKLLPNMTLKQNLMIASVAGDRRRVRRVAKSFGLAEILHQPARLLSGGEAQRAALCRAVINDPSLLLVDEPTSALDEFNAAGVLRSLAEIATSGVGILIASHDSRVASICTRVVPIQGATA